MMSEVRDKLDVAEMVRFEGDRLTPADCEWDTVDDVSVALDIWRQAKVQETAAIQVSRVAGERLAVLLGDGGAAAYGDSIVRYRMKRTERCHDPEGFTDHLTYLVKSGDVDLGDVLNPNLVKKSWMAESVRDTFYTWTDDKPGLTIVPKDRAPRFLQHLTDGEVFLVDDEPDVHGEYPPLGTP